MQKKVSKAKPVSPKVGAARQTGGTAACVGDFLDLLISKGNVGPLVGNPGNVVLFADKPQENPIGQEGKKQKPISIKLKRHQKLQVRLFTSVSTPSPL